jgi:hypothetical protein
MRPALVLLALAVSASWASSQDDTGAPAAPFQLEEPGTDTAATWFLNHVDQPLPGPEVAIRDVNAQVRAEQTVDALEEATQPP